VYAQDNWKARVPLKIKIFVWQLAKGKLPANDQILKRRGPTDGSCALCGGQENTGHIFFHCSLAKFVWAGIRELLECSWNPNSFMDMFAILQAFSGRARRILWLFFAAICWALWNTRNKFTIENTFPNHPADVLYKITMYLQQWRILSKRKDHPLLDEMIAMVRSLYASQRLGEAEDLGAS
jgi:hypothetical protein